MITYTIWAGVFLLFLVWVSLRLGRMSGRHRFDQWLEGIEKPWGMKLSESSYSFRRGTTRDADEPKRNITLVAPFGICKKMTVWSRMVPLADTLLARGHDVTLLIPPWDCPDRSGEHLSIADLEVIYARLSWWRPRWADPILLSRVWKDVRSTDANLVYCFKPIGYSGAIALLMHVARKLGMVDPKIMIMVDTDDLEGGKGWGRRTKRGLLAGVQEQLVVRLADAVSCASQELVRITSRWRGSSDSVFWLPNGTSPAVWGSTSNCRIQPEMPERVARAIDRVRKLRARNKLLLYTRFAEFDSDRLAEIIIRVDEEVEDLVLLTVGESVDVESRREKYRLMELLKERGMDPRRVVLAGWIPQPWADDVFNCATVGLYPVDESEITKTKSYVRAVEMMYHKIALVADAVGDLPLLLEEGAGVVIPEKGQDKEFARQIVELLRNPDKARSIGERARERVERQYLWEEIYASHLRPRLLGVDPLVTASRAAD